MMKPLCFWMNALVFIGCMFHLACSSEPQESNTAAIKVPPQSKAPAIVLVSFGTSNLEARKVFDHIDQKIHQQFPSHDIYWAYTAQMIIDKLKKQGIVTYNLNETLSQVESDGHRSVVLQSLHVVPGEEYSSIETVNMPNMQIALGAPLLSSDEDIDDVIKALESEIQLNAANVVVGHGNDKHPEFNDRILAFTKKIENAKDNVIVATVEGQPGIAPLERAKKISAQKNNTVHFIPLMMVKGVHIMDDVLGQQADSWKNLIGASTNTCSDSLGYNDQIVAVYLKHLKTALTSLSKHSVALTAQ